MQLANLIINVILMFIGAQLGNWLDKPQDNLTIFYWISILIFNLLYIQYLINENGKLKSLENDVQAEKDKVSRLLILKETNGIQTYSISFYVESIGDKFYTSNFKPLKVYISSPFPIEDSPSLEIRSESRFEIKIDDDIIIPTKHIDKYVYFVSYEKLKNRYRSKKYFMYDLKIKATTAGVHEIDFIAESKYLKATTKQKIECS